MDQSTLTDDPVEDVVQAPEDVRPAGWVWHAFHEEVLTWLEMSFNERYEEIIQYKPEREKARRTRMMRLAHGIPFERAKWAVVLLTDHPEIIALHEEQCVRNQPLGCPWDDEKRTLFPELPSEEVGSNEEFIAFQPFEGELV